MIEQLTVFIQNEKGRLSGLCRTLADANINMHDLFIAVVRVFCDTPQAAAKVLDEAGFRASVTKVLAVRVPNEPGGLAHLLETIESMGANIEYGYCFSRGEATAIDVLKVVDDTVEGKLSEAGFDVVSAEEVYKLD